MKSTWDACFKKKNEFSRLHSLEIVVHTIRAKYTDVEKKIFGLDSDISGTSFWTWRKTVRISCGTLLGWDVEP